jgi:hypothetical protein
VDKLPVAYQYDLSGMGDGAVLAAALVDGSHYDLPSWTTTCVVVQPNGVRVRTSD